MKEKISQILSRYVDDYKFVTVSEYIETRSSLLKEDFYSDYTKLSEYKTIITLCISYPSTSLTPEKGYGLVSRYSYGTDYHIEFEKRLTKIKKELDQLSINSTYSVDTGFIDERWASYISHLGFLGKNQYLIHPKYGGYIYLATILIDHEIEKEFSLQDACGTCTKCIEACPTNALDNGFDSALCLSTITQSKHELTDIEISHFKSMIYGCDICQKVCPKNQGINYTHNTMFEPTGIEKIDLIDILKMTNKEYKDIYKNNASSWKGPLIIKRNALCLLKNQEITESIPVIKQTLEKYKEVSWYNNIALKVLSYLERK